MTDLLTGHNTLRTCLNILGLIESPCVGSAEQWKKPQLMFCISVKLWQYLDVPTQSPFCFFVLPVRML
jgi:hypothetical protein